MQHIFKKNIFFLSYLFYFWDCYSSKLLCFFYLVLYLDTSWEEKRKIQIARPIVITSHVLIKCGTTSLHYPTQTSGQSITLILQVRIEA